MSVKVSFSLEEAKALAAAGRSPDTGVPASALGKLGRAIRVVEDRNRDEQLEMKVAGAIKAAWSENRWMAYTEVGLEGTARAAIAAVEEHREGKK